ncbi:hypothetical protein TSUD_89190 [Trifolium subterraneum]|uniref:hAT-like transposase RNase-H fold domain-containing protein n=1 Tax=Trifolium subterraneum TaxID=3900 RepID=A0A2Z6NYW4_TRISU|nr:hypothetical protein TSUD_89190 [Trifolium subterraneum]
MYDSLCSNYDGNRQVQNAKARLLVQQYELFAMKPEEDIQTMFSRFQTLVSNLRILKKSYTTSDHVWKILNSLTDKWRPKVTAIEEAKDLETITLESLISNLKSHEMVLNADAVKKKETSVALTLTKKSSKALKAKTLEGDTIAKKIEEVLRDWGIRKVSTITVDNTSANDVAVGLLKRKIRTMNGLMRDGSFFHMRCNAHILNLIVSDGLKEKDLSISSIRTAVRFIKSSSHRAGKFKECIGFAGITCKKGVSLDVSTRWNSTYLMLESAEKFQLAFEKLDEEELSYRDYFGDVGPPISYDWDIGRAFATFLKLFYEATLVFSSSQEVSIHSAFHQIADIHCELQEACLDLNSVFASVCKEMVEKYNKYWGNVTNMNKLLYLGVILDPRFKMRIIEWKFKDMYEGRAQFGTDLLASIEVALTNLYNWYKQEYDKKFPKASPMVIDPVVDTTVRTGRYSRKAKEKAFDEHLEDENAVIQNNELQVHIPCLIYYGQRHSCYTVSTVASESAFSTRGRVIETFRSSLKPAMTEALICAQQWLKPTMTSFKDLNLVEEVELSKEIINGGTQPSRDGCP